MERPDYTNLLAELAGEYARRSPSSAELNGRAKRVLVEGGSHSVRLLDPFPPRIRKARGAWIEDEDGHNILDFWQGHYGNILGHNPDVITKVLAKAFAEGRGTLTGLADRLQTEVAEILCQQTHAERVRLTTSGSLATMCAVVLSLAFTGRELVMKAGGGWHGSHPWGWKGVHFVEDGFGATETEGLPVAFSDNVLITRFNDPQMLRDQFRRHGGQIGCLMIEPFIGAGGFMFATPEYLKEARELTAQYGTVLLFDEIISGFRFRAGDLASLYGIQPDLAAFGKVMGGGMPIAAVVGREEIMQLVSRRGGQRVGFSGGTYSAHPASLMASKIQMEYLIAHESEIYPRLAQLGSLIRQTVEAAFTNEGIHACCTGYGNERVSGSSIGMLLFPHAEGFQPHTPEDVHDPQLTDVVLRNKVLPLALLLEDVYAVHGTFSLSVEHTENDIEFLGEACRCVARKLSKTKLRCA